jgi:glycosyltransferase involved in cell wall biosynthesis
MICVSTELKHLMIRAAHLDQAAMVGFSVTPVGVCPASFNPAVPPADLGGLRGPGTILAGYMGTLTAWHGVDLLFAAAALALRRGLPIVFVAYGGEPERVARLRRRADAEGVAASLRFAGGIDHDQVPAHLAAMDVCLIPDTQDWSSPTKFFEYAAMARPIVAVHRPSVVEVFGAGEPPGLLFERGDAGAMVDCVMRVASDPALAERLGRAARARVVENYTRPRIVGQVMELFAAQGLDAARATVAPVAP